MISQTNQRQRVLPGVAEWPNAPVCKTGGQMPYGGSNPPPWTKSEGFLHQQKKFFSARFFRGDFSSAEFFCS